VRRVLAYLAHGYRYSQTPPTSRYPLEDFLFVHKLGYCQHFAGAMALLLRMGGVPARVVVGFTPGSYNRANHSWAVTDLGAHAWVEAWFPSYGWVRFDPTPRIDPALAPAVPADGGQSTPAAKAKPQNHHRDVTGGAPSGARGSGPTNGGSGVSGLVIAPAAILALLVLLALLTRARSGEDPVGELTRAFARSGRPLETASTLSGLEQRLTFSPDAARYVRALRLARYGPAPRTADRGSLPGGRRALRRALGAGLGPVGRVRAWWALPPRWHWPWGGPAAGVGAGGDANPTS
jgi:hypothetical protein